MHKTAIKWSGKGLRSATLASSFTARATQVIAQLASNSRGEDLARLLGMHSERDFVFELSRLASRKLAPTASAASRRLEAAHWRGVERIIELRRLAEPTLETQLVCRLLGVSRETIRKMVQRRELLALPKGVADRVFPAFQFDQGRVVTGLGDCLRVLSLASPFGQLSFFLSESPVFGGRSAIVALRTGNVQAVLAEAAGVLKHGT